MSNYSIVWDAILSATSGTVIVGDVLVKEESGSALTGYFVKSTTANRGTRRSTGIAVTPGDVTNPAVNIQVDGEVPASVTGLGAGLASWVRVSSAGRCERCTPGSGDDLIGKCDVYGTLTLDPGVWDSDNYDGGGGGGSVPTGTGFPHITSGSQDAAAKLVENADVHASAAIALSKIVNPTGSGVVKATAGVIDAATSLIANADVSASAAIALSKLVNPTGTGVVKATAGAFDAAASTIVNADVNAAAAIALSKLVNPTGTGLVKASAGAFSAAASLLVNADVDAGAAIAISKLAAIAASDIASGTLIHERGGLEADVSAFDGLLRITGGATSAVAVTAALLTFLATSSSANFAAVLTDETGSGGGFVRATGPTISGLLLSGNPAFTGFTSNASTGTLNNVSRGSTIWLEFTNVAGPAVTGLDATGAVDGTICIAYSAAATVSFSHEDAGSTAANRIELQAGTTINLPEGCCTIFFYRSSRWHHLAATAI